MRSALTILGIIIGVAAVLAMLAIGEGAKRIVMQEFEKYGQAFNTDLVGTTSGSLPCGGVRGSGAETACFQIAAANI
jgi:putative ABC transport system permease protein